MGRFLEEARTLLASVGGQSLSREERMEKTGELAALLVKATKKERRRSEKRREKWLGRMMQDPAGKGFMTAMTDQCFRSHSNQRTADQLHYLLKKKGIPKFLAENDRFKMLVFCLFGRSFPNFFVPQIKKQLRKEMSAVLLPETRDAQIAYIRKSRDEGITVNLNHLGEAILGEEEAERRLQIYLDDLAHPDIDYISVKITTIFSQVNLIGWEESLEILAERLRRLYRAAGGTKWVNLDMEEYQDLDLTIAVFKKVLSEPEFLHTQGGIVLQSYLPEAFTLQQELTEWAAERLIRGGAPIKIRIVKGANLAMEWVESSLHQWELPTFSRKVESDANLKRMLEYATEPAHAQAVHIGLGSHNLFDISYVLLLRAERGVEEAIGFEMLEGMAEAMHRVIRTLTGKMLLYCPEARPKDFHNAVAYLIRRLDENTGPENYLRKMFEIKPHNSAWQDQASRFENSCRLIETLPTERRRPLATSPPPIDAPFHNAPDLDFSLAENRKLALEILNEWKGKTHPTIPLVIGGKEIAGPLHAGIDPSHPSKPLYHYTLADEKRVEEALMSAQQLEPLPFERLDPLLADVAQKFRERRAELIGAMVADGGKTVAEADPEVSEAIDFIEYYRKNWEKLSALPDISWSAKGTVLIAPPWNFPCSIPAGGIAAALTTGNRVIFKPAPETVLVGWHLVQLFWEGGIPKEYLQFFNCLDEPVGSFLVQHEALSSVILTGATATAKKLLTLRPGLDLHAETGGKNALIVTAMCDRDLAVHDIIQSAFGHGGQKCSACSLAILEGEIYDDPDFRRQLRDAATSLKVGSAWDPATKVNPLIRPPEEPLYSALMKLEEGEEWLVKPQPDRQNPHLWSPGIKIGVRPGSVSHHTEFFGPLLSVMRAPSLEEAVQLANATPYGLTSGLHSLDEREQNYWKEHIIAGNLYINRGITGAIVRRQPFGGCKASSVGPGAKAGGPNYLIHLARPIQTELPHERAPLPEQCISLIATLNAFGLSEEEITVWKKSAENYAYWAPIFFEPTDPSCVHGQDNFFYLVPKEKVLLRLSEKAPHLSLLQVIAACLICNTPLEISTTTPLPAIPGVDQTIESEEAFCKRTFPSHIRLLSSPSDLLKNTAASRGALLIDAPVLANGRLELPHYLREVTLSHNIHRYGYISS